MKKVYKKPAIVYENFELSQNIAAGCAFISHYAMYSCAVKTDNIYLFSNDPMCEFTPPAGTDTICYNNFSEDKMVFTS